jgi:WD40 repeat protein
VRAVTRRCLRLALAGGLAAAACGAPAADPPARPILRIETDMHAAFVRRLVVDPERNRLITAGDDKTIRIWQLPQRRLIRVLRFPIGEGYEGRIYALAITPDGRTIAAGGWTGWEWDERGAVYLFDAESGELKQRIATFPDIIGSLAYSKDGRHLAVGLHAEGGLWILRSSDYAVVARDPEYRDKVLGADFHVDGRLAVAALDGQVRLYDPAFRLLGRRNTRPGVQPLTVRFSPDGAQLAVSFHDVPALAVLSANDLGLAFVPDRSRLTHHARLTEVAWSSDGQILYGCGDYSGPGASPILAWEAGGRGEMSRIPAARQRIADLQAMPHGGVAFAAEDPAIGVIDAAGRPVFFRGPDLADFRDGDAAFKASRDGARVQFSLARGGEQPVRFSLFARELLRGAAVGAELAGPIAHSDHFALGGSRSAAPTLNGKLLRLDDYEMARTYAVSPDDATLLLGTEWALRAYGRDGVQRWKAEVPGVVESVLITQRGEMAIAALSDGTIRWYRMADGGEFLALFVHVNGDEWIAWTPEGYYASSNYGDNFVGWHVNRGKDAPADFYRAVQFERLLYRPDLVDETFRQRGRPSDAVRRRALARFDVSQLTTIAPPRVRIELVDGPRVDGDGQPHAGLRIRADRSALPMVEHAVFVNGIPVTPSRARDLDAGERQRFERSVAVPLAAGENRVRVEVSTGASLGVAETVVDVAAAEVPRPSGALYALAIGVNEFPGLRGANLAYAARDAEAIAAAFASLGASTYSRVVTRVVSDAGAAGPDRARILESLELLADAGPNDTVILFLASHGISDAAGNYFFVPRDARAEDVAAVVHGGAGEAGSLIRWTVFFDALRRAAGRRILIVDTCNARNMDGRADVQTLAKRSAASRFSLVLASSGSEESQEYPPAGHGLFTYALLSGLRGDADGDGDGIVTLAEAFRFAAPVVERLRDRALGPQTPQLVAPAPLADAILLRRAPDAAAASRAAGPGK